MAEEKKTATKKTAPKAEKPVEEAAPGAPKKEKSPAKKGGNKPAKYSNRL